MVWSPAGDRFGDRSPPRVSFVYAKGAGVSSASWELVVKSAHADANRIRFTVPADAPAGAGTLYVTAWGNWPEVAAMVVAATHTLWSARARSRTQCKGL